MNKLNLPTWLSALCAVLVTVMLVMQAKQKSELAALRQGHAALTDQVGLLSTNWEAKFDSRIQAKSDEIVATFAARLNQKATEAATQVANVIRLQTEEVLKSSAAQRSNQCARLIEAASRYEKDSRPELTELCYLSALKCCDGNVDLVLRPFLAWKERSLDAMTERDLLTRSPAALMALYESLDRVLPDSSASPDDIENALAVTDRIRARIVERQRAKLNELRAKLSWEGFDAANLPTYEALKETLAAFSPADQTLETEKTEVQELADNVAQTARAMNSFSTTDILPPSPKAPTQLVTNWFERGLVFVTSPTNGLEARLNAVSVLMDFAQTQTEAPECKRYTDILTNESVKLACAQWTERVDKYYEMADKKGKPDADTLAVGQSLLNQGFAILKSFSNKTYTAEVSATLPRLASKLYLQREMLLVSQMRLADRPGVFSSKEQSARARSMLSGQMISTIFDLRTLQDEISKECSATPDAIATLKEIEGRIREYLVAYEKRDEADREDAKADQLAKMRQQYQRYANHCRGKIYEAWLKFKAAERVADEWFATWGNERAQDALREGLRALYSIDVHDLIRADPGLAAEWSRIEELLKKHFRGTPSVVNAETPKKSLYDF